MYIRKHLSVNDVLLEEFNFRKELAMESYILDNPKVLELDSDGFKDITWVREEIALRNGRIDKNTDGRIDLLAKYGDTHLAIVELKRGELEDTHLEQLEAYLEHTDQLMTKLPTVAEAWGVDSDPPKWFGVLVGAGIAPDLMVKLRKGYYVHGMPIGAVVIRRFKEKGNTGAVFVVTDSYFPRVVKGNDLTKYLFRSERYGKGRLVLAVLLDYVRRNPTTTYPELERAFPHALQGKELFRTQAEAERIVEEKGTPRHFLAPDEILPLKDANVAVSSQWGLPNIGRFIEHARGMGLQIDIVRP